MVDNASSTGASTIVVPQPLVDNDSLQAEVLQHADQLADNTKFDRKAACDYLSIFEANALAA